MDNIINSLYNIGLLDELSKKDTSIHKIHPVIKLVTTIIYLITVVSFNRYEIIGLLPFVFYPIFIFCIGELPLAPILKRVLLVEPLIIGIGILNVFFDNQPVLMGSIAISRGWITFLSIFIKCGLTVTASILLIATTGMDKLAASFRMLRVPKIFVLQLLLTYRYITILIEEVSTMSRAYALRAPGQKGINFKVWGSFAGQLLLRTYDRAQRIYDAMNLRGFVGEYNTGSNPKLVYKDYVYLLLWCVFFIVARYINIPVLIGEIFSGVIK